MTVSPGIPGDSGSAFVGLALGVAVFVLLARLIDLFWLIAPEFHTHGIAVSWLDRSQPPSATDLLLTPMPNSP